MTRVVNTRFFDDFHYYDMMVKNNRKGEYKLIYKNGNTLHLQGRDMSYIMFTHESGDLLHFYFGKKLEDRDYSLMKEQWSENWGFSSNKFPLDVYPQEYPAYGYSDLRNPAYQVLNQHGNAVSRLCVQEFEIQENTVACVKGMPSLFQGECRADTLKIRLYDEHTSLEVHLYYTVFEEHNIIARSAVIKNKAQQDIQLMSAYSASIDFPLNDYDMVHFAGAWGREREMQRTSLTMGMKAEVENARGGSGHQLNPFVMIASPDANETAGEVYGFSLVYSGNHSTVAKADQFGGLRVQQGINPHQFQWELKPGESFDTPQSVICYSSEGFGAVSREYHDVYRDHLMRSKWVHKSRPVLLNNWEGTYFDFTEEKLVSMAEKAREAGIELFVLDDGWFGKRNNDACSLGDWIVNKEKLPSGIDGLADKINGLGLKFGLWFEPEMVSPDSDLYRAHPDWAVHVEERTPVESRHQLVLDLSRDEVCEYIIKAVSAILSSANIGYVKWDMNRQITDMPCLGYNHRYTLGYYKIMSAITAAFPDVLFEGCSAGGARFDPGVLAYMPQIWASDNSDAVARLKIQYATSMCYPVSSISSHVTVSPNHQCGRVTTLKTRGDVAYAGTFGYELDITKVSEEEFEEIKQQIVFEKQIQQLVREGDLYRLLSPYETNYCSWEIVSKDKKKVFLFACKILAVAQTKNQTIKLQGLDPAKQYRNVAAGTVYGGDLLMHRGIRINYKMCDFATEAIQFEMV